ncbi:MAG: Fic family protein [Candidatus Competibacteraceae bacterium]|jgi:Fic family protein|nr:Fic family protein [Candidatus Competibacteraceae bacterium]
MFAPKFQITPALSKILMDIEGSRQTVADLPITLQVLASLRDSARLVSTHYSTQIEGNRLTQAQVADVLQGGSFPSRERDEREVRNYYQALDHLDRLIKDASSRIVETDVQRLHGLVMDGKQQPTPHRDGQNVIRDSGTGAIVYMPPEAADVANLMGELIDWNNAEIEKAELPVPIIEAIAHYQFATIHPYYDGNGRTARLLTNLVLHKCGYGLKGIYSLEEYYARDLPAYYRALAIGESHNYYFGRAEADITGWVAYFCAGMADAFAKVRMKAAEAEKTHTQDHSHLLRELDPRQKQVLVLFQESRFVTTRQIAELLGIHTRSALNLCKKWVASGFLIQHGQANKSRQYELAEPWVSLVS